MSLTSPFANVFVDQQVPPAFQAQFFCTDRMVLEGEMTRVWLRHGWLRPFVWLLSRAGLLIGQTGDHIPTRLEIHAARDAQDSPQHVYKRALSFATPERFDTITAYLPKLDRVVEFIGPGGVMLIVWNAEFQPPDRLRLSAETYGLRLFGRVIVLPAALSRWLVGSADFVQTALADDRVSIDFTISHPLLGNLFGYEGIFDVRV